ncbi:MAG: hypothetical protein MPK62_06030, partial [Alphaproteobacteria bacterium]|nr:hypothetical protein [Alphaproteobacteria bacterium]
MGAFEFIPACDFATLIIFSTVGKCFLVLTADFFYGRWRGTFQSAISGIDRDRRRAAFGISGREIQTLKMLAQASDASRWVRASPQK